MADDAAKMFVDEYKPVAERAAKEIGVDPTILLSQWAMETNYGRSIPGHFNLGNIKDFSGAGTEATDRQTESADKYVNFESPEAFGDYYAHMMKRLYPNALNAGSDIKGYASGLMSGVKGSYAETTPEDYESRIKNFHSNISSVYKPGQETLAEKLMREGTGEQAIAAPEEKKEDVVSPLTGAAAGAVGAVSGTAHR